MVPIRPIPSVMLQTVPSLVSGLSDIGFIFISLAKEDVDAGLARLLHFEELGKTLSRYVGCLHDAGSINGDPNGFEVWALLGDLNGPGSSSHGGCLQVGKFVS
ncbi:hypothetical protein SBC1_26010 [Caballeronia sp. SBC1]|nr:hypothetical protein SBC1_26010 [Caballeronia sp. SBC1]